MNETIYFPASVTVRGDDVRSILKHTKESIMICGRYKAIFINVDTLDQLKVVIINSDI